MEKINYETPEPNSYNRIDSGMERRDMPRTDRIEPPKPQTTENSSSTQHNNSNKTK